MFPQVGKAPHLTSFWECCPDFTVFFNWLSRSKQDLGMREKNLPLREKISQHINFLTKRRQRPRQRRLEGEGRGEWPWPHPSKPSSEDQLKILFFLHRCQSQVMQHIIVLDVHFQMLVAYCNKTFKKGALLK